MKVSWAEITKNGVRRRIKDTGWSAVAEADFVEFPQVEVVLAKIDEETVTLKGSINATIETGCSRCGQQLQLPLSEKFEYAFIIGSDHSLTLSEFECSDEDCSTVYLDEPVINLIDVVQEQLILVIPQKPLCDENCKGVCPQCGTLLKEEQCGCIKDNLDSPFAVLRKLKK